MLESPIHQIGTVKSEAPMPLDQTLRVSDLCARFFPKYSSFHRLRSSSSF